MATLGSDKLTGIRDVDGNDSATSKRYVDNTSPSIGGSTKSYLKSENSSFSNWNIRTMGIQNLPVSYQSYQTYGFIYSEKDNILLESFYYTNNDPNHLYASTDAIHWTLRTVPVSETGTYYGTRSINYANNIYFVDNISGHLWTSTDSIGWIARTSPLGTY